MKFKFSLEPVLKVRKHQEKLQQQKLAEEQMRKKEIDRLKNEIRGKLENFIKLSEENGMEKLHDFKIKSRHLEQAQELVARLEKKSSKAGDQVDMERQKLATVHKHKHILEKLKEIEKNLFTQKRERSEQKKLDEIAAQNFGRTS